LVEEIEGIENLPVMLLQYGTDAFTAQSIAKSFSDLRPLAFIVSRLKSTFLLNGLHPQTVSLKLRILLLIIIIIIIIIITEFI